MRLMEVFLIALLFFLISGCTTQKVVTIEINQNKTIEKLPVLEKEQLSLSEINLSKEDIKNLDANNKFAFDIYSKQKSSDNNFFFSPYSISNALAIAYEGAKGQTAEEIQKVFYFSKDSEPRKSAFARIYNQLNKANKSYQLNTANALWVQKDYPILEEYQNATKNNYGASATNLDFINQLEASRLTINNWVENKTNQKIKNIVDPNDLNYLTRLVITNAIYFKGSWEKSFDKKDTYKANFTTEKGDVVAVQMMQKMDKYNYFENEKMQIIELPYKGNELSMLIILSKKNKITEVEKELSVQNLENWKKDIYKEIPVTVSVPRFKFETRQYLNQNLSDLGMPTAFDQIKADFSGITGNRSLYIETIIHQAVVEVNEEGTEAAAATVVGMSLARDRPVFMADHPFIFIIQDKQTGTILFMGKVNDPSKS